MLETRWEPVSEINRLRDEMNRLFGRYDASPTRRFGAAAFPPVNVWEDESSLFVDAELPGFELADLEIYVTGGDRLSINGQRKQPELPEGAWRRQERGFGRFGRVIELPARVDSDKVTAEFKHGVLTMTLPKSEECKPRRIQVKAS